MFQFDHVRISPEKQIGRHSQSGYELDYIITGRGTRTLGSLSEPFQEGEVVLVPPELPHQWAFDPKYVDRGGCIENITFIFQATFPEKLAEIFPGLSARMLQLQNLSEAVRYEGDAHNRLVRELMDIDRTPPEARSAGIVSLMSELTNLGNTVQVSLMSRIGNPQSRLDKTRVYVHCNFTRNITLSEIASYVGMNRTAFCSFFKKETGKTFITALNEFRLEKAAELLCGHPELSVSAVAEAVGFESIPYFTRCFTKWKGLSPGKWRAKMAMPVRPASL